MTPNNRLQWTVRKRPAAEPERYAAEADAIDMPYMG